MESTDTINTIEGRAGNSSRDETIPETQQQINSLLIFWPGVVKVHGLELRQWGQLWCLGLRTCRVSLVVFLWAIFLFGLGLVVRLKRRVVVRLVGMRPMRRL